MIRSYDDLQNRRATLQTQKPKRLEVIVCAGTSCLSSDSDIILDMLQKDVLDRGLDIEVEVVKSGCFLFCGQGPMLKVMPDDVIYVQLTLKDVNRIIEEHIIKGNIVTDLLYERDDKKRAKNESDTPYYKKQRRIALRNLGIINPDSLDDYLEYNGYEAMARAITKMTPEDVIEVVKPSGLRGRGGGGFPTGLKWKFTRATKSDEKYVICNADEGDPGAFMDRSIMEGDPHSIIEAMIINGYAVGANNGLIYIRAEYEIAAKPLFKALIDAREAGLLGKEILGTDFSFDIEVKLGAGAFVCGEQTALIHSMEGKLGEPTTKPPFPSEVGFRGKPSNVNNVETYANIPPILVHGADWFNKIGTKNSKGTKVFALAGNIENIGLVEVPMGTTFREIIYDIGGGIPNGKKFKAVQIGGPSGGVVTEKDLDMEIDYDSLQQAGSMMGSGGMIVMDEDTDIVEIAKFYLDFTQDESCGKCTPCRIGTKRLYEILEKLTNMEGTPHDLELLETLSENVKNASLCGLGQSAPNPVLSTLKHFRDEYEDYAYRRKRTAYVVDGQKCIGCTKCARVCPVDCIDGKPREVHVITESDCIACGACYDACPVDAIIKP